MSSLFAFRSRTVSISSDVLVVSLRNPAHFFKVFRVLRSKAIVVEQHERNQSCYHFLACAQLVEDNIEVAHGPTFGDCLRLIFGYSPQVIRFMDEYLCPYSLLSIADIGQVLLDCE